MRLVGRWAAAAGADPYAITSKHVRQHQHPMQADRYPSPPQLPLPHAGGHRPSILRSSPPYPCPSPTRKQHGGTCLLPDGLGVSPGALQQPRHVRVVVRVLLQDPGRQPRTGQHNAGWLRVVAHAPDVQSLWRCGTGHGEASGGLVAHGSPAQPWPAPHSPLANAPRVLGRCTVASQRTYALGKQRWPRSCVCAPGQCRQGPVVLERERPARTCQFPCRHLASSNTAR